MHYLRKHLVNRTVKSCQGFEDTIVYGKVGCSHDAFVKAVQGKKVTGAGQQGKYFYLTFDSPPHSVMHLGMTGWIKFSAEETGYYKQAKVDDKKPEEWPPKYMKWLIKCDAEGDREAIEVAFIDARRLARIRLVECDADKIREESPLKENGPDPVIDKHILTVEWLTNLLNKKKVPVKALLLDQANISGVGNWVADEVLYQARLHPEQYCNTFDDEQTKRLHDSLIDVCTTACDLLADSSKFPENWLMKYRWDKGKKGAENKLPNGAKIEHITVGGRTSAIVPSVQKKTAAVAGDVKPKDEDQDEDNEQPAKPAKGKKRKAKTEEDIDGEAGEEVLPAKSKRGKKAETDSGSKSSATANAKKSTKGKKAEVEATDDAEHDADDLVEPLGSPPGEAKKISPRAAPKKEAKQPTPGSRRSTRNKS